ncbi:mitotic checkpoint regulator, MAD2B-interacting-domain-containing protein [Podospora australis]|uniref:Mitotic checkpoint regulator, MAD2B-interacting-domain-containing protein n=1 Tax=Podospora australis TaxID=1536484 RepID=A0AAN6WXH3_9PEZI|nr:mitotic checkpoint regulator, MAD2B-interacting-domain-containing protein [Podospora australis]
MALVDYSDSDSDSEPVGQKPTATSTNAPPKKPFQKLLDRGKIVVNLPTASLSTDTHATDNEQPAAKKAKTAGGSRFGNFASFLPAPKKAAGATPTPSSRNKGSAPAPGVHLKTGAEPAFIRGESNNLDDDDDDDGPTSSNCSSGLSLPAPKKSAPAGPSIPEGMKPESEIKFVGKPLMFKPLSVARRGAAAATKRKTPTTSTTASPSPQPAAIPSPTPAAATQEPPLKRKKISLFSLDSSDSSDPVPPLSSAPLAYEPVYTPYHHDPQQSEETDVTSAYPSSSSEPAPAVQQQQNQLSNLADSMSLSAAARRELFGRTGASSNANIPANAKILEFNMEQQYASNEVLRQSGEQVYNPVRAIQPGKHSLRQVVNAAQNNQSALEDAFAAGRAKQRDAAGRYGWK